MKKQNKILIYSLIFVLSLLYCTGMNWAQKKPKDTFDFPKLNPIKTPKVQKVTLKNGLKLFLVEDHQYPTIGIRAIFKGGSVFEPAEKVGLAAITGAVLRTGGTQNMAGDEIDRKLESMGASIETGMGETSGYVQASMLKENVDQVLQILTDILQKPVFDNDKIELAKTQQKTGISRRNDQAQQIANREFAKILYGKKSPYARHTEYATIDAITRKDIVSFYKKFLHPRNMTMAVWGDFKTRKLVKKLNARLGQWRTTAPKLDPIPEIKYDFKYTVNLIDKPDLNQSTVLMGHIAGLKNNPDYPALSIMNSILSYERMFKTVRTNEGLAYAVWGFYGSGYRVPGIFNAGTMTKSQSTVKAIRLMIEEIRKMRTTDVTDEELKRAKDQFLNSFVFNFDSKAKIINRMLTYSYFGYPLDFADQVKKGIEGVTKGDVKRVAEKYLNPDKLQILVVGKKKDFDEPLEKLGSVNVIDITIPVPEGHAGPKATPKSLEKGKKIYQKTVAATGDIETIKKVRNMYYKMDLTQVTQMGEMTMSGEAAYIPPDKMNLSLQTPGGPVTIVINGDKDYLQHPGGKMAVPPGQKKSMLTNLKRDQIYIAQNMDRYSFQYIGKTKFKEQDALEVLVKSEEVTFSMFVNPDSFLPMGITYQEGPSKITEIYSDYRKTDGIMIAFKSVSEADGKKAAEFTIKEAKLNADIDPAKFKVE